jgi:thiamine-phosphate pyrophosphorylase
VLDVFYPIVPDVTWLQRIVPLGVRTVQLRLKNARNEEIAQQVRVGLTFCRAHGCQLIINDHWQAAIDAGGDFIHLGQDDLAAADLAAIRRAGLKLGVSTHSLAELETALAVRPDYVALGPIYETKLKAMPWAPQGLDRLREWRARIGQLPLVAIGGITPDRAAGVLAAGADSCAVITDFLTAPHPEARVALWLDWARLARRSPGA